VYFASYCIDWAVWSCRRFPICFTVPWTAMRIPPVLTQDLWQEYQNDRAQIQPQNQGSYLFLRLRPLRNRLRLSPLRTRLWLNTGRFRLQLRLPLLLQLKAPSIQLSRLSPLLGLRPRVHHERFPLRLQLHRLLTTASGRTTVCVKKLVVGGKEIELARVITWGKWVFLEDIELITRVPAVVRTIGAVVGSGTGDWTATDVAITGMYELHANRYFRIFNHLH